MQESEHLQTVSSMVQASAATSSAWGESMLQTCKGSGVMYALYICMAVALYTRLVEAVPHQAEPEAGSSTSVDLGTLLPTSDSAHPQATDT